jgi:hypothetical protein
MAFKSKITANIGVDASPSTLTPVIASGQTATLIGLSIANTTGATINVSARVVKADTTSAYLIKNAAVLPGGALAIVGGDQKVVIEQGDSITASASAASSADAVISYLI